MCRVYEKTDEEKADTAEDAGAKNSAPEAQETADAENMEEKTEEQLLVEELGLTDTFDLQASLSRLRERGFGRLAAVKKIKKEGNWTYFTVTDTDGVLFYTDTNRHGGFGPILSQTGMDNAEYVQKPWELKTEGRYYTLQICSNDADAEKLNRLRT